MLENPFVTKSYLIVDDFGDMRIMIKGLIHMFGATKTDTAKNGAEAIAMMERNRYDVILCDYNLGPGKDGQQVLEEARHRKLIGIDTVFIMITAENTREMVMGAVEYEPDNYLSKPFTKDLLRARLGKIFQRKEDLAPINVALERKNYAQALQMMDERIAARPKNLGDLIKLKAETLYIDGQYAKAGEIYEQILAGRDVAWARLGLGKVQFALKRYADATDSFQFLVTHHKNVTAAYDWLAKTQQALGFTKDAQITLRTALSLSPKAINRQQALGEVAMLNKDFAVAEGAFDKAVRLGKNSSYNNPMLYSGLAKAKSAVGKPTEALEVVGRMGEVFSTDRTASFYAAAAEAQVKKDMGDEEGAAALLGKAEKLMGELGFSAPPRMGLELARAASHLGNKEQAARLLEKSVLNNHDNEALLAEVADTFRSTGINVNPEGVVDGIRRKVIDMNNRGVRLIQSGELDQAIGLFEQAAEGLSGNLVINLNAAKAFIFRMEKRGADPDSIGKLRRFIERIRLIAPEDTRLTWVLKRYQQLVALS